MFFMVADVLWISRAAVISALDTAAPHEVFHSIMDRPKDNLHSREEIREYIARNYPELANARSVSIGLLGSVYRVAITDSQRVDHTIHIDPKEIDADREKNSRTKAAPVVPKAVDKIKLDSARRAATGFKRHEKNQTHDHDRER